MKISDYEILNEELLSILGFDFSGMKKLESLIKTYNDFPQKGIAFKDLLEIIQDSEVFRELILKMSSHPVISNSDAIIAIDARGFIFGSAISFQASKPMIVARKPGKLPGELIEENYNLEYGKNSLSIQKDSIKKFNCYAIVDDVLATGGTVDCVAKLVNKSGKNISGLITVVELINLGGKKRFAFPVESMLKI